MKISRYELTQDEYDAMAYVVPDPTEWIEHVVSVFDEARADQAVAEKIAKCLQRVKDVPAKDRKTRKERYDAEMAAMLPSQEQLELQREMQLTETLTKLETAKAARLQRAEAELTKQRDALQAAIEAQEKRR